MKVFILMCDFDQILHSSCVPCGVVATEKEAIRLVQKWPDLDLHYQIHTVVDNADDIINKVFGKVESK